MQSEIVAKIKKWIYSNTQLKKREYVVMQPHDICSIFESKHTKTTTAEIIVIMGLSAIKILKDIRQTVYIMDFTIVFLMVALFTLLNT